MAPNPTLLFFMGLDQAFLPGPACTVAGGVRCIADGFLRLGPATASLGGMNSRILDFTDPMDNASMIMAGQR